MYVYSELVAAQLENLGSDPTGVEGRIYYHSSSYIVKWYANSGWHTAMDLDTTQSFSGKTCTDDMTFSSTGAITVPVGTTAQRPGTTNGMFRWNTDDNRLEVYGNSTWNQLSDLTQATATVAGIVTAYDPVVQSNFNSVGDAAYTVLDADGYRTIFVGPSAAGRTITLPTAADNDGRILTITNTTGTDTVTVDGEGSETIGGATTVVLHSQNESLTIQCDGSNWQILSHTGKTTPWADYTPTLVGFGTVASQNFEWRRVDENIEIRGEFVAGTPTATEAQIPLPNSLNVGGTSSGAIPVGVCARDAITDKTYYPLATDGDAFLNIGFLTGGGSIDNPVSPADGDELGGAGLDLRLTVTIPIQQYQ